MTILSNGDAGTVFLLAVNEANLFPNGADATSTEQAAFDRIKSLVLYGADPAKFYSVKFLFWKDVGTRFNLTIVSHDDADGTNQAEVASFSVGSGADVWAAPREITLAQVSSSGVTGTAVIDFTSTTAMSVNSASSTAAMYQRRQIAQKCLIGSTARTADIGAQAASSLNIRNRASTLTAFAGGTAGNTTQTGLNNTAFGYAAADSLTSGADNSAFGLSALTAVTTGSFNSAYGSSALFSFTGSGATAFGNEAAYSATTATNLTAIGRRSARSKVTGADDTYLGFQSGWSGQVKENNGEGNTGIGAYALGHNTGGDFNTGCGRAAGWYGDTANKNSWLGYRCGYGLATGDDNLAGGFYALHNLNVGNRNVFLGSESDAIIPASSMTATAVAGAGLSVGAYTYRVSFVLDSVETALSEPPANVTTTSGNQQVNLATIPTYSGPRTCSARRIYRTPVGGENLYYLVGTIANNTTTTFSDTTADASLSTQPDALNNSIAIGYRARVMKSGQMVIGSTTSRITEAYIGGGVDDTSPAALTLGASNASGTNVAGADLRLRAGTSTGTGKPGNLILSAAAAGSSGSMHNATTDWVTLDGRGFLNIVETTSASVPTPAAGSVNLFVEGGSLKFRNSAGTVLTVTAT